MKNGEIIKIFRENIPGWVKAGQQLLLVVPDTTRTAPMAHILEMLLPVLRETGCNVTVLVALGTHPPMSAESLREHLGLDPDGEGIRIINHAWKDPGSLVTIGSLAGREVEFLTGGLMDSEVKLQVNREVASTDVMVFLHPVFPHELVGFSGGSKYIFPGISGPEMIDIVHWLGALGTTGKVMGRIDTPGRRVLDTAAEKMPVPMYGLPFVYHDRQIMAMEAGELRSAWRKAAAVSKKLHIRYMPRKYKKVLACCPPMYPDLWTGGKCVYKCEQVVDDGGELIVYAPHVETFSEVHDDVVEKLGYHVCDYFVANMDRYEGLPLAVMAYCAIIKGRGTCIDGVEHSRINVSFASRIPRRRCEEMNIGYVDPDSIRPEEWTGREDEGILCVERAGEILYRIESDKAGSE